MPTPLSAVSASLALAAIPGAVYYFWEKASADEADKRLPPPLLGWFIKGFALPLITWFVVNSGLLPGMPPLVGPVDETRPGSAAWISQLPERLVGSSVLIAAFWGGTSLCWLFAFVLPSISIENRRDAYAVCCFWSMVAFPIAALILWLGGVPWLGLATMVLLGPPLHGLFPLRVIHHPVMFYSRAVAHMKFGKYAEAERAVLAELEKSADDLDGWMLLAELYAERFHDLPLADQTIREVCSQPNINPVQIAFAYHRLADWHLKLGQDPAAARRALLSLREQLPETHFARMAEQRLRQLPQDRQELLEQQQVRPLRLPTLKDPLDDDKVPEIPAEPSPESIQRTQRCVEKLQRDPNLIEPREELAHLLVEQLGNIDEGIGQVLLLLDLPSRPPEKTAEWLSLLAAWHLRYRRDNTAARIYLERIVRDHPHAPQAFAAQRRLNLLDVDARLRKVG